MDTLNRQKRIEKEAIRNIITYIIQYLKYCKINLLKRVPETEKNSMEYKRTTYRAN
jgi:hypothetical protein